MIRGAAALESSVLIELDCEGGAGEHRVADLAMHLGRGVLSQYDGFAVVIEVEHARRGEHALTGPDTRLSVNP